MGRGGIGRTPACCAVLDGQKPLHETEAVAWSGQTHRSFWRKSMYSVQQRRKTCCPLSSSVPVSGSWKENARPPRYSLRSIRVTEMPRSTSEHAAARPARPPPITTQWPRAPSGRNSESTAAPPSRTFRGSSIPPAQKRRRNPWFRFYRGCAHRRRPARQGMRVYGAGSRVISRLPRSKYSRARAISNSISLRNGSLTVPAIKSASE